VRRIVLYGATGYTGRLVAAALVSAKARPVLAGRSGQNLAALGAQLGKGLDTAVADAADPEALLNLFQPDDVVVNTAGPFSRIGTPVVEAAIQRRATYIDSAGEPSFLRTVHETIGPAAAEAEVAVVPGSAYEYAAGSLAAALAIDGISKAVRVDIGYFAMGDLRKMTSAGTKASAGAAAVQLGFAWRRGELVTVPPADQIRMFAVNGEQRPGLSFGGLEHLTLPKTFPWLREVGVYVAGPGSERLARITRTFGGLAYKTPGLPATVRWLTSLPRNKAGPDEAERAAAGALVIATASDDEGRELRTVKLGGTNPYTFSGRFLAWAALRAATIGIDGKGALGPLEAFGGTAQLRAGVKSAGLTVTQ
jgi:Saccharopine dehydrogenase NADP binding domain